MVAPSKSSKESTPVSAKAQGHAQSSSHADAEAAAQHQEEEEGRSSRRLSLRKSQPRNYRALSGIQQSLSRPQAAPVAQAPERKQSDSRKKKGKLPAQASSDGADAYESNRRANIKANEELLRSLRFDDPNAPPPTLAGLSSSAQGLFTPNTTLDNQPSTTSASSSHAAAAVDAAPSTSSSSNATLPLPAPPHDASAQGTEKHESSRCEEEPASKSSDCSQPLPAHAPAIAERATLGSIDNIGASSSGGLPNADHGGSSFIHSTTAPTASENVAPLPADPSQPQSCASSDRTSEGDTKRTAEDTQPSYSGPVTKRRRTMENDQIGGGSSSAVEDAAEA